ncbi:MAG: DUF296 domain-containing protein [Candidatus Korarchaeota archaeon]|nr:DUF296 domain-containing protein [Candidatus Korarchaeota archaeon]
MKSFGVRKVHVIRVDRGEEVVSSVIKACSEAGIGGAVLSGLGLLSKAKLAVFNPEKEEYETFDVDTPMELASLAGNVSLREGKPFAHIHVVLGNKERTVAGHLVEGYVGGTCEIAIIELEGELKRDLKRGGLFLLNV